MKREDAIKAFFPTLTNGERAYFLMLTGHIADPKRTPLFEALYGKIFKEAPKPPWETIHLDIEHDPDNPHDPFAMKVMAWHSATKDGKKIWTKSQIGFIKATDNGEKLGHNRAFCRWLANGKIFKVKNEVPSEFETHRVHPVHVTYDKIKKIGTMTFAVVTHFDALELPVQCKPIMNFGRNAEGKIEAGKPSFLASEDAAPAVSMLPPPAPKALPKPAHEGVIPTVVADDDLPDADTIWQITTMQSTFKNFFYFREDYYDPETKTVNVVELAPSFLQCYTGKLQKFETLQEFYDAAKVVPGAAYKDADGGSPSLQDIKTQYGLIMAQHYYKVRGYFANGGILTKSLARSILATMKKIDAALKEHIAPPLPADPDAKAPFPL